MFKEELLTVIKDKDRPRLDEMMKNTKGPKKPSKSLRDMQKY